MTDYDKLLKEQRRQIDKALGHLEYSYKKVQKLSPDPKKLDDEDLETWESFVARFARASDLFLSKYIRTAILQGDPAFRGSFRDFLDQAEKMGLVDQADAWMAVRELRNQSAHEYSEEKLAALFEAIRKEAPLLLGLKTKLKL